jgi:hypothetical protein
MVAAAAILVVVALVLGIAIPLLLRSWGKEESRVEARLHDPDVHTVAFAVPDGMDPAVFRMTLTRAGFTSGIDRVGDLECLIVECSESDRARVRSVIEAVHLSGYDGSDVALGHVVFEDER